MRGIKVAIAVLFLSITAGAQAVDSTQHLDSPINGITEGGCSEEVALSGIVHGVIHLTRSAKDQQIIVEILVGPRGDAYAVGMTTGNRYNLVGNTFTRYFWGSKLEAFSYVNQFKVVGLYSVHYTYHVSASFANPDEYVAYVDNFKVSCQ